MPQINFSEINHELILFALFNVIIVFMLVLDLGILTKKAGPMSIKKAGYWTLVWVSVSMLFAVFIYFYDTDPSDPSKNQTKTMEFIAGYLLEYSLSIDNLFVFIMIFQKFRIGPAYQPEILKWGIIGAVFLRAIMILLGSALVVKFSWILYVFGFFLIYTAFKMFTHKEDDESFHPENNLVYKLVKKVFHVSHHDHHAHKFFVRDAGKLAVTPLFVVLCLIETSDVMFALDSIPAVFSVTQDPFIVYTSNIFAILGLRSLYFMISGIMDLFVHLKTGVALILAFVGFKMILPWGCEIFSIEKVHVPIGVSLAVIVSVLITSVLFSLPDFHKKRKHNKK